MGARWRTFPAQKAAKRRRTLCKYIEGADEGGDVIFDELLEEDWLMASPTAGPGPDSEADGASAGIDARTPGSGWFRE
ncbi:hypothetical protein DL767_010730 [Monosporascus sp. MG133]|nr:hypothetical protein DL767_010730 [Monosporascus sp. MG133]